MSKVFLSTAAFNKDSGADTAVQYLKNGITKVELSGGIYLENQIEIIKNIKNVEFNLHNYFPPPKIPFVINKTAFGIDGVSPCHRDYIEFFDTADNSGTSVAKYCGVVVPEPVIISSEGARIVFQGRVNPSRRHDLVGVMVTYHVLGRLA